MTRSGGWQWVCACLRPGSPSGPPSQKNTFAVPARATGSAAGSYEGSFADGRRLLSYYAETGTGP